MTHLDVQMGVFLLFSAAAIYAWYRYTGAKIF